MAIGFQLNDPVIHARASNRLASGDDPATTAALEADIGLVRRARARERELRSPGDEPDARDHAPARLEVECDEHPLSRAAHARRHAADDRHLVQHRPGKRRAHPALADQQQDVLQEQLQRSSSGRCRRCARCPATSRGSPTSCAAGRLSMRVERYAGNDRAIVDADRTGHLRRHRHLRPGRLGALLLVAAVVGKRRRRLPVGAATVRIFGIIVTSVIRCGSSPSCSAGESDNPACRRNRPSCVRSTGSPRAACR